MIKSMTAFSRVQQSNDGGEIVWEIKSVNHRYLEPGLRLPEEFRSLEPNIRQQLGKNLKRGKVDISLRYKLLDKAQASINLNTEMVKKLRQVEQQVLGIVHEGQSLSVADILRWPGVVDEVDRDFAPLKELALESLHEALKQLVESREQEGAALQEMIASRCDKTEEIVKQVQKRRPEVMDETRQRWENQIKEKLSSMAESADPARLEQELVMLAQKMDVEEELDRLLEHIQEVKRVLNRKEPVGRRLDFLMQELNREANTLSSKSQDSETTRLSVDLKVLIEQMREQVQNIE